MNPNTNSSVLYDMGEKYTKKVLGIGEDGQCAKINDMLKKMTKPTGPFQEILYPRV